MHCRIALKQLREHCEATSSSQTCFYWRGFHSDTLKLNDKGGKDQIKINSSRDVIVSSVENKKLRFGMAVFTALLYVAAVRHLDFLL